MAQPIIILGVGGNSIDLLDILHHINKAGKKTKFNCMGFLDDSFPFPHNQLQGLPILGPLAKALDYPSCLFINGIGSIHSTLHKEAILQRTGVGLDRFAIICHPSAVVSPSATIGPGSVIFPMVTLCSNSKIGQHVLVLPQSVLSHDSVVGDYSSLASGVCLSGNVKVGRQCYLGSRCVIREHVQIGDRALIGMGSVVLQNVENDMTVYGNPAKVGKGG
ncbi:MAG: acetyltransferase [Magnetococcales bacterium]|nr:acetyltransferase [Magnetococcales bacterium]NGZ28845.1 acetyltransferase [Magnetococcales bacterium]